MSRPDARGGGGVVLLVLLGGLGVASLWLGLSEVDQQLLALLVWHTNELPALGLGLGLVGLAFAFAVGRRRLRWVTPEHRQAAQERRAAWRALPESTRRRLLAPPALALAAFALPYVTLWACGALRYSWGAALDEAVPAWVRLVADVLTGPGHAVTLLGPLVGWGALVASVWSVLSSPWRTLVLGPSRPRRRRLPSPGAYQQDLTWHGLQLWKPDPVFLLGARETAGARRLEPHCPLPSWRTFEGREIFGGLLLFGQKGSGKTQTLLRIASDALAFCPDDPARRPALVALDPKGDLSARIEALAAAVGRSVDVTRLAVGGPTKWNPFGHLGTATPARELGQAAYFLICALPPMSGDAAFWEGTSESVMKSAFLLLAWAGEPVSFTTLRQLVTQLAPEPEEAAYRRWLYDRARDNVLADDGENPTRLADLQEAFDYLEYVFVGLDDKPRSIVVSLLDNFLGRFSGQEYRATFCGDPGSEPDHFDGFEGLVDDGGIFVLDLRSTQDGPIQGPLCVLAKLFLQVAIRTRDVRDPQMKRVVVTILDEYQQYATVKDQRDDDAAYFETSRAFRAVDVAATQQPSSLAAVAGHRDRAQRLIGSFNSVLLFRHNDPWGHELANAWLGQREVIETSSTVQEGGDHASRWPFALDQEAVDRQSVSRSVQLRPTLRPVVQPSAIAALGTFEAIGIFNGPDGRVASQLCTKPLFLDVRTSHAEVLRRLR